MNKKQLAISGLILGSLITSFICGCATAPQTEDKATAGATSNIRISGDLTEEVISRKGF